MPEPPHATKLWSLLDIDDEHDNNTNITNDGIGDELSSLLGDILNVTQLNDDEDDDDENENVLPHSDDDDNWSRQMDALLQTVDDFSLSKAAFMTPMANAEADAPLQNMRSNSNSNHSFELGVASKSTPHKSKAVDNTNLAKRRNAVSVVDEEQEETAESILRQARAERQQARLWVARLRDTVQTWMALRRQQQQESAIAPPPQFNKDAQYDANQRHLLQQQQQRIQDLEHDLQTALQHHLQVQSNLHAQIRNYQAEIEMLRNQQQQPQTTVPPKTPQTRESDNAAVPNLTVNMQQQQAPEMVELAEASPLPQHDGPPAAYEQPSSLYNNNNEMPSEAATAAEFPEENGRDPSQQKRRQVWVDPQGTRHVFYQNGAHKAYHTDGTVVIRHTNGDIETTSTNRNDDDSDDNHAYFFAATQTWQRRSGGAVVWEYPTGQIETYTDTHKTVQFPDGTCYQVPLP